MVSLVLSGLLMSCMSSKSAPTHRPTGLRVMTCNIRLNLASDGNNSWPFRRAALIAAMKQYRPDLLGTQEVLPEQMDDLSAGLSDYISVGVARDDGKRKGEFSALFFRGDRFDLLDSGTFWLSQSPEMVGSKSWDAALTRICTWTILFDRNAQRELLVANTHFDHVGKIARERSAELLARKLPELSRDKPVILLGDFNCTEDDAPYAALTSRFIDAYRTVHPQRTPDEATFHEFKGVTKGSRIDWILHSREFAAIESEIDRTAGPGGVFLSDHYPVTATLSWKR